MILRIKIAQVAPPGPKFFVRNINPANNNKYIRKYCSLGNIFLVH